MSAGAPGHLPHRGRELIARFLGEDAASGGPFALLGVDPAACTPSAVDAGWQRQLDRIAQHAEADTAEADQVRLALDAAARELHDPISRAAWLDELRRVTEARAAAETTTAAAAAAAAPSTEAAKPPVEDGEKKSSTPETREAQALVMRLLVRVALGLGFTVVLLLGGLWVMRQPMGPPGGTSPTAGGEVGPPAPAAAGPAEQARVAATSKRADAATPPSPPPPPLPPLRERGRSEFSDGASVIRELRAAVGDAATDPGRGLARFERVNAVAADWWCRYDAGQLRAAADAVVELLYKIAPHPDHAARLVGVLTEPLRVLDAADARSVHAVNADEVWPAGWAGGVVARCGRERELPTHVLAGIGSATSRLSSTSRPLAELSFEAGAAAALTGLPRSIIAGGAPAGVDADDARRTSLDAMKRWVEAVTLTTSSAPERRERAMIEALGMLLTDKAEPDADPRVFDAISLLASEIKWKAGPEGGGARGRLMDWFRDPRVSPADLRAVTSAIATKSGAEGVDATMVLSMTAQSDDRPRLRDRYAQVWSLAEASARDDEARQWVVQARPLIDAIPEDDELEQLAAAAELAEQNWRAIKIWRGDAAGGLAPDPNAPAIAPPTPAAPTLPVSGKIASGAAGGASGSVGNITGEARDGAWAEGFLQAERNIPIRLERLAELERVGPPIGWIDAGVLAETACFGSPSQVRAAAQKTVSRFADEPAMVSALLDLLPIVPRIRSVSDVYARVTLQSLPRPADAGWELATRRALVERLLSMITDDGVHGQIEQIALRIATCYLDAVDESPPAATSDGAATGATRGARMLLEQVRNEAASLPISHATRFNLPLIERRSEQRRVQAIGPVQGFSAEQAALAETMGALLAAERPEREAPVAEILEEMAAQRRKARHVFGQIWAAERAIARLWLLRLNTEGAA